MKNFNRRSQDSLSKTIQKEVTVLASLHHANIVKYHGAWLESFVTEVPTTKVTIIEQSENLEFNRSQNSEALLPKTTKHRYDTFI
jgi:hypothetical protein